MNAHFDLQARARRAMVEAGFQPDLSADVRGEVQALAGRPAAPSGQLARDLRDLLWSSIDNDHSRDLDQIEYVEPQAGGTRLLVGIADVDALCPRGTAIDTHAALESTSVYTGVTTFPMLPDELSADRTSLLDAQERLAMVMELFVTAEGEVSRHEVYPARVRNAAKLAYSSTGAWLEGRGAIPPAVAAVPGMEAQLRLQLATAQTLRGLRKRHGALTFGSIEATPVMDDGRVKELSVRAHNVAEDIIESFMVAANVAMAKYLRERGQPCLRRVVRTPRRWDRIQALAAQLGSRLPDTPDPRALSEFLEQRALADPEHFPDLSLSVVKLLGPGEYIVEAPGSEQVGHFGLAVTDYTHSTAPNRRYADLVTQRLLKGSCERRDGDSRELVPPGGGYGDSREFVPPIGGYGDSREFVPPGGGYSQAELAGIAAHCTDREDAARKVERLMRKVIAACLLSSRVGEVFDALVTGASAKGTYARLLGCPAEGRVIHGTQGIDVGDKIRVRLASVDIERGFIDLDKA